MTPSWLAMVCSVGSNQPFRQGSRTFCFQTYSVLTFSFFGKSSFLDKFQIQKSSKKLYVPEPPTVVILLSRSKGRTCETNRFGPMKFHYCDKVGHSLVLVLARATEKGETRATRDLLHNTRSATGFPLGVVHILPELQKAI